MKKQPCDQTVLIQITSQIPKVRFESKLFGHNGWFFINRPVYLQKDITSLQLQRYHTEFITLTTQKFSFDNLDFHVRHSYSGREAILTRLKANIPQTKCKKYRSKRTVFWSFWKDIITMSDCSRIRRRQNH